MSCGLVTSSMSTWSPRSLIDSSCNDKVCVYGRVEGGNHGHGIAGNLVVWGAGTGQSISVPMIFQ